MIEIIVLGSAVVVGGIAVTGFKTIRPTEKGLIERFGKYRRFGNSGLNYVIPFAEKLYRVNTTEMIADAKAQEIITKDKLNATVDAQVYYRVKQIEDGVKASKYNVNDVDYQIVSLARTTLRNIIGTMSLNEANSERNKINDQLKTVLEIETKNWGIEIVRTELKEINPPRDVQDTMNKVVKAENDKLSAIDYATAVETKADGEKRAKIKEAEGVAKAIEIEANAKALAIKAINESAEKYFVGNAQKFKQLEVTENALKNNAKIVLPEGKSLINVIGDLSGGRN